MELIFSELLLTFYRIQTQLQNACSYLYVLQVKIKKNQFFIILYVVIIGW